MIYHITTRSEWQAAQKAGTYSTPSLQTEGFIHNSTAAQVVNVGNAFYHNVQDCVLLCIDETKVLSSIKWEPPAHPSLNNRVPLESEHGSEQLFPHIYGTLNLDAVLRVVDFAPDADGQYHLPEGIN